MPRSICALIAIGSPLALYAIPPIFTNQSVRNNVDAYLATDTERAQDYSADTIALVTILEAGSKPSEPECSTLYARILVSGQAKSVVVAPAEHGKDPLADRQARRFYIRDVKVCHDKAANLKPSDVQVRGHFSPLGTCVISDPASFSEADQAFLDDRYGHTAPDRNGADCAGLVHASRRSMYERNGQDWTLIFQNSRVSYNLYAIWTPLMRLDVSNIGWFDARPSRSISEVRAPIRDLLGQNGFNISSRSRMLDA